MSDAPEAGGSSAMRRSLRRYEGATGCPCFSDREEPQRGPAAVVHSDDTASMMQSVQAEETDSADSSNHSATHLLSDSQDNSDSAVPDAVLEPEWSGLGIVRIPKCAHSRHATLKKAIGGKHAGRRFLGCALQNEEEQCQFVEWLDEPWPERIQESLKDVWKVVKQAKRNEARVSEALQRSLERNDTATAQRVALQEEVNRTKRMAERICRGYQRQAIVAKVEKNTLMFLMYCLVGVIILLVAAMVFKSN